MANLKQLRRRIKSAKNTFQITRATKLVSAAKLRRSQEKASHVSAYIQEIQNLIYKIKQVVPNYAHPLIEQDKNINPHQKYLIILITADRGLAGSFNNAIIKTTQKFIETNHISQIEFICIGKKGLQFCQRQGYKIITSYINQQKNSDFQTLNDIGITVQNLYLNQEIQHCFISYSKFHSAIKQEPLIQKLLPIQIPDKETTTYSPEILFESNPKTILDKIITHYLNLYLYQVIMQSIASEHAARMSAMSNATENASKMINKLTIINNRERQARITKEISEIVGGAEALSQ